MRFSPGKLDFDCQNFIPPEAIIRLPDAVENETAQTLPQALSSDPNNQQINEEDDHLALGLAGPRHHLVEIPGRGKKEFQLPDKRAIVEAAKDKIKDLIVAERAKATYHKPNNHQRRQRHPDSFYSIGKGNIQEFIRKRIGLLAKNVGESRFVKAAKAAWQIMFPSPDEQGPFNDDGQLENDRRQQPSKPQSADDKALHSLATILSSIFQDQRFTAIISSLVNHDLGALKWAIENSPQYKEGAASLLGEYQKFIDICREALPELYEEAKRQLPEGNEGKWKAIAIQVLESQKDLAQMLFVLSHYAEALAQYRDASYPAVEPLIALVEEASRLFFTGDIVASKAKSREALVQSIDYLTGKFIVLVGNDGPATLPGAAGPVGLNLMLVPEEEVGILMLLLVLYIHELGHDVLAAIDGLAEVKAKLLFSAIKQAVKDGTVKLSQETILIGKSEVPLDDLIASIYLQNLGEIYPDLFAIGMCGWAFSLSMLYVFGAFNSRRNDGVSNLLLRIFSRRFGNFETIHEEPDSDALLRTYSHYAINKKGELRFEAHPIDYLRAYICAAYLDIKGFRQEANRIRSLANGAVGSANSGILVWHDAKGKRPPIEIQFSDMAQFASIVVHALMEVELELLGGRSDSQVASFSHKHQAKTDALAKNLVAGLSTVPADQGTFHLTFLAAATAIALFEAQLQGKSDNQINQNSLLMAFEIVRRNATKPVAGEDNPKAA